MYVIVLTRPNISHSMSVVNRYMAFLGREHWKGVKWIIRYIRGTLSLAILYRR